MGAAGYNDHAFWAVYIADVITFIGVSYGGAVVSAILRLTGATWRAPLTRLAEGTAVCTVLVGGALIIPHIGRPQLLYELVTQPNLSAPVFWDFIAVTTYTFASVNAAVTSETTATITLTGSTLTQVEALLNNNGTTSASGNSRAPTAGQPGSCPSRSTLGSSRGS